MLHAAGAAMAGAAGVCMPASTSACQPGPQVKSLFSIRYASPVLLAQQEITATLHAPAAADRDLQDYGCLPMGQPEIVGMQGLTCSAPILDRSQTMSRLSAPHDARMVSKLGFHPICTQQDKVCQGQHFKHETSVILTRRWGGL